MQDHDTFMFPLIRRFGDVIRSRTSSGILWMGNGHPERHSELLENRSATFVLHKTNFSVLSIVGVIPQRFGNCGEFTQMCGTD
jgi:hypothetical protein